MKHKLWFSGLTLVLAARLLDVGEIRGVWRSLPSLPTSRQEVGVAELNGQVYVIGGLVTGAATTAHEAFDTETGAWQTLGALPTPLHHVGAAAVAGKIYSIGGYVGFTFSPVSSLLEYDPETDLWTARAPLPRARGALAAAAIGGKIYVVGGNGPGGVSGQLTVYDPLADLWTELPPLPTPREHLAAAALGGKLFVIGGRVQGPLRNLATLEVFDPEAGEWETRTPMPTARSGLAAAAFGELLLVFGGEIPRVFEQNEVYDPASDSWFELTPMPVSRHGIGAAVVGNRIIIPGGATIAGFVDTDVVDEFFVLDQLMAMAQFAEGPDVTSHVTATNFTDREVTARLELYDDQGNVLESGLTGPGGPDRTVELQSYQTARWSPGAGKLSGASETIVGWALLFSDQPLLGHILFTGPAGFAGVLGRGPGASFLIPVERSQNQNSGIAVANASRFLSTVMIRLRDANGPEIADTEIELEPFGHRALFLDQLFPDLDLPSFIGSLEGSADQLTAAMAILQRDFTQLATLPARID